MKKLLFLLLLLPALVVARVPDEEDILARTLDTASPYYYPSLTMRFNVADTTLTNDDYHYLYYGYAYQDAYKPLEANPALDKMLMLTATLDPDRPNIETLEAMILAGAEVAKRDPFSPKMLNLMAFAYGALGDKQREAAYYKHTKGIIRAISESGDGLTQKTPRHILMFDHALDVLTTEGLSHGKSSVISRSVEFIPLTVPYVVDGRKRKGFYYDFSRIYRNKPEGYTYQRDRTWQFNNLKPRTYK